MTSPPANAVLIGGQNYLVGAEIVSSLSNSFTTCSTTVLPITIVDLRDVDDRQINSDVGAYTNYRDECLAGYLENDDVICSAFVKNVVVLLSPEIPFFVPGVSQKSASSPSRTVVQVAEKELDLRGGPYFLVENKYIHKAYRLYEDQYQAFVTGTFPHITTDGRVSYNKAPVGMIPVPSRLYHNSTPKKPLSGLRFAVKDIFDIRGLAKGSGSRAFRELYSDPATDTAPSIQHLIDLGAEIVGVTKSTFLVSGCAPRDWIDYQCPFNPRGDGYLDPGCSSAGSAAAIAGYEWLDCSIGSDSLGSMVGPASLSGAFGIRPTLGSLSNEGSWGVSELLDVAGHFCRNYHYFSAITKLWIEKSTSRSNSEIEFLIDNDRFKEFDNEEAETMTSFIKNSAKCFNLPCRSLEIEDSWQKWAKDTGLTESSTLSEYLSKTLATIQLYDSHKRNQTFYSAYRHRFASNPAMDPLAKYKYIVGGTISKETYDVEVQRAATFSQFLQETIFAKNSSAVIVLPGGWMRTLYRNEYPGDLKESGSHWQGYGFTSTAYSSLAGLPCVAVPFGTHPYLSEISGKVEEKPASVWLVGAPGSDNWLVDSVIDTLVKGGMPPRIKPGKKMY